jgi:translation elongation factor EF-1beta
MKKKNKESKKGKKKEVDKSHVILEIKGWDAEQDLEALAKKIISTIKKDGLQWNTGYKLEEVAFGIKKLVIAFLAEDEKCSVQEIQDELESWKDDIQSVDIVSFNKS